MQRGLAPAPASTAQTDPMAWSKKPMEEIRNFIPASSKQLRNPDVTWRQEDCQTQPTRLPEFRYAMSLPNRQAFSETIGCRLASERLLKCGRVLHAPFTRHRPGECGSASARLRASWSVTFWHQICHRPENTAAPECNIDLLHRVLPMMDCSPCMPASVAIVGCIFAKRQFAVEFDLALVVFHGDKARILVGGAIGAFSNSWPSSAVHQSRRLPPHRTCGPDRRSRA